MTNKRLQQWIDSAWDAKFNIIVNECNAIWWSRDEEAGLVRDGDAISLRRQATDWFDVNDDDSDFAHDDWSENLDEFQQAPDTDDVTVDWDAPF